MLNIKIYKLLYNLDTTLRNRFTKYVDSPYFNANPDLVRILAFYNDALKSNTNIDSKEEVWNSVYPEKSKNYDDKRLRHLNTKLLSLFEDFIAQEKYNEHPFLKTVFQLEQVAKDEFEILENQLVKQSKVIGNRYKELSSEYHLSMFQIENSYFYLTTDLEKKSKKKSKIEKFNFEKIVNHLDTFYLAEKLKFIYSQLFWESYSQGDKSDLLNDQILEIVNKGKFRKNPLLLSLYYAIRTITDPDKEKYFESFRSLVQKNFNDYSRYNQKFLFDCLFTYAIRKANTGNRQYHPVILELYKDALQKDILVQDDVISPVTFRNIVLYANHNKQYDWAESFINEYASFLPTVEQENAVNFNLARIHFFRKEFEDALEKLNQVNLEDIHYTLISRSLLVAIYYELNEFEALMSSIDSFRVYLNRTTLLSKQRITRFKTYLKYAKKLAFLESSDKSKVSKVHLEIQENSMVNKQWLLEKVGELRQTSTSVNS